MAMQLKPNCPIGAKRWEKIFYLFFSPKFAVTLLRSTAIACNGKSIAEGGEFMYYCLISAQKFNSSAVAECGYVRPTLCNAMLAVVFYVARAI